MMGSVATFGSESEPSCSSRRISSPTTRKNTVISPSFTQKCRSCSGRSVREREPERQVPQRLVGGRQGELAQSSATAAASSSTMPLAASTLMKRSSHTLGCRTRDVRSEPIRSRLP